MTTRATRIELHHAVCVEWGISSPLTSPPARHSALDFYGVIRHLLSGHTTPCAAAVTGKAFETTSEEGKSAVKVNSCGTTDYEYDGCGPDRIRPPTEGAGARFVSDGDVVCLVSQPGFIAGESLT